MHAPPLEAGRCGDSRQPARTFAAVTTCHAAGYEQYGRRMVEAFDHHWPREIVLYLYAEGFVPDAGSDRVVARDLLADCPDLVAFKARHQDNPRAHGQQIKRRYRVEFDIWKPRLKIRPKMEGQGYRWNAVRFAHKTFSILDAAERCSADVLFWIDADTVIFEDIPLAFLDGLVPEDCFVSCLRRPSFTECGFVGYNLKHPATVDFLRRFKALYTRDKLFREAEYHDSWLFDVVRRKMERKGHKVHDIAEGSGGEVKHIFVNSPLGRYMDHLKGDRKTEGSSRPGDLSRPRSEAYWTDISR